MTQEPQTTLYQSGTHVYEADTCKPLTEAVQAGTITMHALARHSYPGNRLRSQELNGICAMGYWDAHGKQNWGLPLHRNEGIELTMMFSGSMPVRVNRFRGTLNPGEVMITRPWQPHSLGNPDIASGQLGWLILDVGVRHPHQEWQWPSWIILDHDDLAVLTRYLRQNEQCVRPVSKAFCDGFAKLVKVAETPDAAGRSSRIAVLINDLLLHLLDHYRSVDVPLRVSITSSERTVRLFIKDLAKNITVPWTVDSMAEACGLGVTHFTYHFRRITAETPAHYLARIRLETAAKSLLQEPDSSVADIAHSCGFTRSAYFIYAFRKHFGKTPAAYRKSKKAHPTHNH